MTVYRWLSVRDLYWASWQAGQKMTNFLVALGFLFCARNLTDRFQFSLPSPSCDHEDSDFELESFQNISGAKLCVSPILVRGDEILVFIRKLLNLVKSRN